MEYQFHANPVLEGRRTALRFNPIKKRKAAGRLLHKLSCLLTRRNEVIVLPLTGWWTSGGRYLATYGGSGELEGGVRYIAWRQQVTADRRQPSGRTGAAWSGLSYLVGTRQEISHKLG
jgi:hypothetical protein